jgi:hypothetical protein
VKISIKDNTKTIIRLLAWVVLKYYTFNAILRAN